MALWDPILHLWLSLQATLGNLRNASFKKKGTQPEATETCKQKLLFEGCPVLSVSHRSVSCRFLARLGCLFLFWRCVLVLRVVCCLLFLFVPWRT